MDNRLKHLDLLLLEDFMDKVQALKKQEMVVQQVVRLHNMDHNQEHLMVEMIRAEVQKGKEVKLAQMVKLVQLVNLEKKQELYMLVVAVLVVTTIQHQVQLFQGVQEVPEAAAKAEK